MDVWIVAANAGRRDQLAESLAGEPSIRVTGTARTMSFLRSMMADQTADVAVIDVAPESDTDILREWLVELEERIGIVLLTPEPSPTLFRWLSNSEAGGALLSADASADQLIRAIVTVASGLSVFDVGVAHQPVDEEPAEALTPRESDVLRLLADGLANREIAAQLGVSGHTVKFHIRSILGKLGASTRTEAVSRGLRSGLIEL